MTTSLTPSNEIESQFDDAQNLFDEHIQSQQVMCRIAHAFNGAGHNCLGCNFNATTQQISSLLNLISKTDQTFTLEHAASLYFLQLNMLWERITDIFEIISYYHHYCGFVKDAYGVLPLTESPYTHVTIVGKSYSNTFESPNQYIYCMTRQFLSDSFRWAIDEGKQTCVLITHVDDFCHRITKAFAEEQLEFQGVEECFYSGDLLEERNPSRESFSTYFLADIHSIARIKPLEYSNQREVRARWKNPTGQIDGHVRRDIPDVSEFCIRVNYPQLTKEWFDAKPESVGSRIHLKDGPAGKVILKRRWEICSPIIYKQEGERDWMIGFHYPYPDYLDAVEVSHCQLGMLVLNMGPILGIMKLNDVSHIEYFDPTRETVDGPPV